jgi:hypothetical protein
MTSIGRTIDGIFTQGGVSSLKEVIKRVPKNLREKQQQDEALEHLVELSSAPQAD